MKNEVRYYNPDIYPVRFIRTIDAYLAIGDITIKETDHLISCEFSSDRVSAYLMANEFDNYLIELLNAGAAEW